MNEFLMNLKRQAQENPLFALTIAGAVLTTLTQFLRTGVDTRNSRVWAKEVGRRIMKDAPKK